MGRKVVAGYNGEMSRSFIGEQEFCAETWNVDETAEESDTTNTCGAGYAEQEFGVRRLEGRMAYTWDVAANPWVAPVTLSVGSKHAESRLYVHAASGEGLQDGPYFGLTLQVSAHGNEMPQRGKVSGNLGFVSFGAYTLPTGSDSSGS